MAYTDQTAQNTIPYTIQSMQSFAPLIWAHWTQSTLVPDVQGHTGKCLYRYQYFLDKVSCARTSPPPVCLSHAVLHFPSFHQSASNLSHWSHYQLLPNRKRASLLSWGSRCLPIVVVWSDSEIYSHRPGRRGCMCVYSMCVCYLIDKAWYSHPVFLCWSTVIPFSPLTYWMWTGLLWLQETKVAQLQSSTVIKCFPLVQTTATGENSAAS